MIVSRFCTALLHDIKFCSQENLLARYSVAVRDHTLCGAASECLMPAAKLIRDDCHIVKLIASIKVIKVQGEGSPEDQSAETH